MLKLFARSHGRISYLSYYAGEKLGDSVLLADRLYLAVPALVELDWLNENKGRRMELVTLAKSNANAYEKPPTRVLGKRAEPGSKAGTSSSTSFLWSAPASLSLSPPTFMASGKK